MPFHLVLLAVLVTVFIWSGIAPHDRVTWLLEIAPVLIALPILFLTAPRFRFTNFAYGAMALHAVILMIGAHYTYSEVPLFNWLRDSLDLARNHYDRVGHLAQGFFPAIVTREILLRLSPLQRGRWLFFIVTAIGLAISAFYELLEWWSALVWGGAADAFLATQGDIWDTQWDMFLALIGVLGAQLFTASTHDRALKRHLHA